MNNLTDQDVDILYDSEFEEFESESSSDLLFNDNWYKDHPDKILGIPYQSTGKYGVVTYYSGTIEVINKIDVNLDFIGAEKSFNDPLASVSNDINISAEVLQPEISKVVEKAIRKSFDEEKTAKTKKKKIIDEDAALKPISELNSFEQTFKNLNPEISIEEIEVHTWYKTKVGKPLSKNYVKLFKPNMFEGESENQLKQTYRYEVSDNQVTSWVKKGLLFYYKGELLPKYEYQSGNMYDKKLSLEQDKDLIVSEYGQSTFDNQEEVLQDAFHIIFKKRLKVGGDNSLTILATSKFASEFFVERIEMIPEDQKFKIMEVSAMSDPDYGKPNFLKDIENYRSWKKKEFEKLNLVDAFSYWLLNTKPDLMEAVSHLDIYKYYIKGSPIRIASADDSAEGKKKVEAQKEKLKSSVQKEGQRLFSIFLDTQLIPEDKERLEGEWNATFNNYLPVDLNKVPVAFTMAKYVFGKEEIVRAEKRDAVAFTMSNGTGVLSYDVGVGKTPSAIFTISAFMDAGYCKRPLIVVPNQVYKQFISEIKIFTPHIPVIEGYNLSSEYIENFKNAEGQITGSPDYTITVLTYEGLENIGFNEKTREQTLDALYEILNQGGESEKQSKRGEASFRERLAEYVGKGLKGTMYEIESFGFDFICYDEAHKMKKVFTNVKGEEEKDSKGKVSRGKNPYVISSGTPSKIALQGFMINQYILRKNDYKNILLLTATPFTNSPLEIFSMLSMVAYEQMTKSGIENIKQFFDTYVKTSTEIVINTKLKPQFKQVILGFNNLISLQSLIRRFILYKTGEDVKIVRPKKYVLPYLKEIEDGIVVTLPEGKRVDTSLTMTPQQKGMMDDIIAYVETGGGLGKADINDSEEKDEDETKDTTSAIDIDEDDLSGDEKIGVRTIKGLSYSRNLALSPYLYEHSGLGKPTYRTYIETSPKLKYVAECIRSVRDYCITSNQPIAGQVIYMDRGIEYFDLIKEYLVKEVGYREDEIGIIKSGLPKTGVRSKEYIKNLFNGEIYNDKTKNFEVVEDYRRLKIVIGSSTIKEGMNLQKYGAVLYNCFIDWNPTDIQQLEGRIYRQKNTYSAVRIVNPLVIDSADIFLFQKLMEKTARLNTIWSTDGRSNVLNTEEFNPEELKYALIRNPEVIAELRLIEKKSKIDSEILGINRQKDILEKIKEYSYDIARHFDNLAESIEDYRDFETKGNRLEDATRLYGIALDLSKKQTDREGKKMLRRWERNYMSTQEREKQDISEVDAYDKPYYFSDFGIAVKELTKLKKSFLDQYGMSSFKIERYEEDLKSFADELQKQIDAFTKEKERLSDKDVFRQYVEEAIEEKERQKIAYKPLPKLVSEFSTLNYLLDRQVIPNIVESKAPKTCPPLLDDNKTPDISDEALKYLDKCLENDTQTKSLHYDKTTGYTQERRKLHQDIIDDLFQNVKCVKSGKQPIAIFTGGSPASGKSTFINKQAKYLKSDNIFHLDADEIRAKLPEYNGWNANSTHLETSDIVNQLLDQIGSEKCRYDFVYDGTMNKAKKYFPLIKKVKELGYKVYIIFMDIPYTEAKRRALQRYQKTGRYVPMEVIDDFFTEINGMSKGMWALNELKPLTDGYVLVDGVTSEVIEKGGEGIPDTRPRNVYTEIPVKEADEEKTPSQLNKEDVLNTINALKYLADAGDDDAKNTINALKYLLLDDMLS